MPIILHWLISPDDPDCPQAERIVASAFPTFWCALPQQLAAVGRKRLRDRGRSLACLPVRTVDGPQRSA